MAPRGVTSPGGDHSATAHRQVETPPGVGGAAGPLPAGRVLRAEAVKVEPRGVGKAGGQRRAPSVSRSQEGGAGSPGIPPAALHCGTARGLHQPWWGPHSPAAQRQRERGHTPRNAQRNPLRPWSVSPSWESAHGGHGHTWTGVLADDVTALWSQETQQLQQVPDPPWGPPPLHCDSQG